MNNEYTDKNVAYQEGVEQTTKALFYLFYFDEEEKFTHATGPDCYEKDSVAELMDKGEKLYSFFGNAQEAIKAIRFLNVTSPARAKEIINEL